MSFRLLVSFVVGATCFTVLPIYAPFVVLQTEEMPRFLLGLGAGAVAVLALINDAAQGLFLVLACAFVGSSLYVFAYFVPVFGGGEWSSVLPAALMFTLAYLVFPAAVGWALAVSAGALLARRGRAIHQSTRVPTPEADVPVPPRQPAATNAGEGLGASLS